MSRRPSRLLPTAAAIAAVVFVAGVVAWRMTGPPLPYVTQVHAHYKCATGTCTHILPAGPFLFRAPYRLHPLRAEMLWAASALLALFAVGSALPLRRRPSATQPVRP